ncbi:NADH:ubiquinone reductase (Na(+)-transporting) subunit D [Woeseia oceani]|uniref:NADH:ubiquinone reductase (Na(+)-transporting) subunit D n=1 Tax=Woeseia oceani TaxID=1548547 RepID=A0A193LD10_9GAMM|nr:NADH:ubiquinone reductase (Na(+)-transporting) subunit D [Woeseia oceani]ANO50397.1 NADH:ubiquinone reductase (Na(+)-transporting) subunit D [Woeseia oceani]
MSAFTSRLRAPLLDDNPITVQVLGLCSALAVSRSLEPALIMAASVLAVLLFSNTVVSLIRGLMPRSIRLILEVTLIASAVIVVDEFLKAFAPEVSRTLSVFVGLIITNCIVLGRVESFALHNRVMDSIADALGNGLGFGAILISVAATRELLGSGTLLGRAMLPESFPKNEMMLYAPSAFFLIGFVIWGSRAWQRRWRAAALTTTLMQPPVR